MNPNIQKLALITLTTLSLGLTSMLHAAEKPLKLGVISGSEEKVAEVAVKVAKEKYNLDVELVSFSDYITPNAALDSGDLDINAFQHKPYLDQQIKDRGYKFAIVGNTFVYPIAAYSQKIKNITELKDAATIAIPNDPTNLGRSLLLLQQAGLITLNPDAGINATALDIVKNPKKIKIVELEAPMLPRSLSDVDLAIINTTYASNIDLVPSKDGIIVENKESPYVNIIVSRENNKDDPRVLNFIKAYHTEEVAKAAHEIFKGSEVQGW